MKGLFTTLLLLVSLQTVAQNGWFGYGENGKTGWKKLSGEHIPPCSIDQIYGKTVVTKSRKYGMIDASGKLVLDTAYSYLGPIGHEVARPIVMRNPAIDSLLLFSRWPEVYNYGIMDHTGKVIVPPGYSVVHYVFPNFLAMGVPIDPKNPTDRYVFYRFFDVNNRRFLPVELSEYGCSEHLIVGNRYDKSRKYMWTEGPGVILDMNGSVLLDSLEKLVVRNAVPELYMNSNPMNSFSKPLVTVPTADSAYIFLKGKLIETVALQWKTQYQIIDSRSYPYETYENRFSRFGKPAMPVTALSLTDLQTETPEGNTVYNFRGDTTWFSDHERLCPGGLVVDTAGKWDRIDYLRDIYQLPPLFDSIIPQKAWESEQYYLDGCMMEKTFSSFWIQTDARTGKKGLVDKHLLPVLPVEYDRILIGGGRILLRRDGKEEVLDTLMNVILPMEYEQIHFVTDGFGVKSNGKWGYFDWSGKQLTAFKYDTLSNVWLRNVVMMKRGNKVGILEKTGKELIAPKYSYLSPSGKGFTFTDDRRQGLLDATGKKLLPARYRNIYDADNDVYVATTDSTFRLYDARKRKFFAGPFVFTEYTEDFPEEVSSAEVDGNVHVGFQTLEGRMEMLTDGTIVRGPYHGKIGGYIIKGRIDEVTEIYLEDSTGKRVGEGVFSEIRKVFDRFVLMRRNNEQFLFDTQTGRLAPTDCRYLYEVFSCEDQFPGFLVGYAENGIAVYDTNFRRLNPVDFEERFEGAAPHTYCDPDFLYFFRGKLRYTFDVDTLTFSEPVDEAHLFLGLTGNVLLENCETIERCVNHSYYNCWKVTKGKTVYWYTPEKKLYHVSGQ